MHRWKFSVLAAAAAASVGLYAPEASALALGRIHIQSALGEPLRAEIELPDITSAEAETLQASTASPDVFKAQGMEYSGSLNRLQYRVVKRPNGTSVLRVTSDRPVNDPFVDLVLDATWSAGRIVRSYTMLLDPPALRKPSPTITAAPKVSPSVDADSPAISKPARTIATRNNTAAAPAPTRTKAAEPATAAKDAVKVKTGDTASRIANAYKPSSVSLDQMLVAMLRANPDAFVKANVNQLKAGAVLQLPDDATAAAIPPSEARQIVAAQSKNFNTFRRNLAATVPETQASNTGRTAAGTVQTQVDDKTPSNAAPDKLTVTKATIQGSKTAEDTVVKDRQAEETASRITELSKNIADLHKLSGATVDNPAAPPADAGAKTPPTPAVTVGVEGSPPPTSAEDPSKTAAAGPDTNTAATPDSAPATPPKAPESPVEPPAPAPAPQETGFLDGIFENPLIPIGSLAALLLFGFGAYRFTKGRKNAVTGDSSFLESRIQQDSFFGASGGQQIDTANSDLSTGSSMAYTPSQLEAGGDVDPVAEADVYLAYNRDLQAEEILKEAIRQTPNRISAHVKLAEIYAKRQDKNAFEVVAGEVFKLTQGDGPDWQHVVDMGHALDPANALYQPGGQPSAPAPTEPAPLSSDFPTVTSLSGQTTDDQDDLDLDLDLDLDFNLHDDALTEAPNADLSAFKLPDITPPAVIDTPSASVDHHLNVMDLDFPTQAFTLPASNPTPSEQDYQISKSDALEFDLGGLSLDLDVPSAHGEVLDISTADELVSMADDPLATKLALAEEFMMIGDTEGARSYFEEVIAEASGPVKAKAQKLLKELS